MTSVGVFSLVYAPFFSMFLAHLGHFPCSLRGAGFVQMFHSKWSWAV